MSRDQPIQRFAGIDEAGYGPNLGPLVMTVVIAEGPLQAPPDLWSDLSTTVGRAGAPTSLLWVDDSKLVYKGGVGRDRLDAGCLAVTRALGRPAPSTLGGLLRNLGAGSLDDAELSPWIDEDPPLPPVELQGDPLSGAPWKLVDVQTVVVGPRRFNQGLERSNSKATVHFDAFRSLLDRVWRSTTDEIPAEVVGDKHGGRHFYLDLLMDAFPDTWIDRGDEGPELSRYVIRQGSRRLELSLRPRADSGNGLVALASIVSKAVRESWMDAFNRHWADRIPGLKPTAGYPTDAARFRKAIEPLCLERGLEPETWWRRK